MKFRFTAEDFLGIDMSEPGPSLSRYGLEPFQAKRLADRANALLEAELKKENIVCEVCEVCEKELMKIDPEERR